MVMHVLSSTVSDDTLPEHQPLARDLCDVLDAHYPGHPWHVTVGGGMAVIRNFGLSLAHGFGLHLDKLPGPEAVKRGAVIAGGEFLERHGIRRGSFRVEDYPRMPAR